MSAKDYRDKVLAEIDERCRANAGKPTLRHELENVLTRVAKIPLPEEPKPAPKPKPKAADRGDA